VLVLPPFAEELNKSRRMLSLAARVLQRIDCGADVRGGTPGGATTQILAPDRERRVTEVADAASAALMYVRHDPRVSHLVLANPWVSTSAGQAQAYLDAYYGRKFRSPGFWRRMAVDPSAALNAADGFLLNLRLARQAGVQGNVARIDPAPKHTDIAGHISTYREQVTRELSAMAKQGLIQRSGGALVIPNVERLERIVSEVRHTA
jgi:hypothetical protein